MVCTSLAGSSTLPGSRTNRSTMVDMSLANKLTTAFLKGVKNFPYGSLT